MTVPSYNLERVSRLYHREVNPIRVPLIFWAGIVGKLRWIESIKQSMREESITEKELRDFQKVS